MLAVRRVTDPEAIHAILTTPVVAGRLRHDARDPGYIEHPVLSYHGAYVDDCLRGVFIAIQHTPWEIEAHAALLPAALSSSRALGGLFIEALWQEQPELMRITAPVLSTIPSAANYCRRLGFVDEGVRRNAVKIRGASADVIYLGLLRRTG